MHNTRIIFAAILLVFAAGCRNSNNHWTEKNDTMQNPDSSQNSGMNNDPENTDVSGTTENSGTTDDNASWEDVGGVKVRKKNDIKAELEGNSYVKYESYNSGGGSGGYSSESRMTFCPGGTMSMYSQSVTTMNVEGAGGSSSGEESDDGTFDVYEDQQGNLFLKLRLRKGGEGFVHIILEGSKMKFEDGRVLTRKAGGC